MNKISVITGCVLLIAIGTYTMNTLLDEGSHDEAEHKAHAHNHGVEKTENGEHSEKEEEDHSDGSHDEHSDVIRLSTEQIKLANIQVETLLPQKYFETAYAPGEAKANGYNSYIVSPRTDSVIVKRHAVLGDHVKAGQKLVTLFSEAMAEAQADFITASSEWDRVKALGRDTASERTLVEAENIYRAAYGKLAAFGLTAQAITKIPTKEISTFGQYALVAERGGIVLQDDFTQGQRIEAGETIMLLSDENELWVEANIPSNKVLDINIGSPASIDFNGTQFQAKVIQEAHTIDSITRTRIVRLAVNNDEHKLHSGMFVDVYFLFETKTEVIAVPEEALIRDSDGEWQVFVEEQPNEFKAVDVTRGRLLGNYREVEGIPSGTKVVVRGAFFVASEIAKGGFDPHNH